jgi:hypothetical protein
VKCEDHWRIICVVLLPFIALIIAWATVMAPAWAQFDDK